MCSGTQVDESCFAHARLLFEQRASGPKKEMPPRSGGAVENFVFLPHRAEALYHRALQVVGRAFALSRCWVDYRCFRDFVNGAMVTTSSYEGEERSWRPAVLRHRTSPTPSSSESVVYAVSFEVP